MSLPARSAVKIDVPSSLVFTVTNTDMHEGLSRLTLRFPSGYRVTGGSAPHGWSVEPGSSGAAGESGEVSFGTSDEAKCAGAIAPGQSRVFDVEVIAPASRSVTPDGLVSVRAEQSCRGVALDPPATLPAWDRLGIEAAVAAGPPTLGVGGVVTVTLTVSNLSTVELTGISALLNPSGTGSASRVEGPTPSTLTLAPGASGSLTWTARAASAGTVSFGGQASGQGVTSPPVQSTTLSVIDLDVSLSVTPEQIDSGQEVQVQMAVRNRGRVSVANVTPFPLTFDGTATASAPAGPTPAGGRGLEPGESATFVWLSTITGKAGDTFGYSGWASAEWEAVVSADAASNRGRLAEPPLAREPEKGEWSSLVGGGAAGAGAGGTAESPASPAAPSTGGSAATPPPSATVQFVGVNHNGSLTGGAEFSGELLRYLRLVIGWQNLSGSHMQRLELFSPDGALYQQLPAQFAGTAAEARLLVGGTWITQHSLFGAWRVEVYLDRETMPITTSVFVLTP